MNTVSLVARNYVKVVETKHACLTWCRGHVCNTGTPNSRNGKVLRWKQAWMMAPTQTV